MTPATKSLLSHAAQLKHATLTDFLISSTVRAAEEALVSPRVFEISSDAGWNVLMGLLDEPQPESRNANLGALLKPNT